MIGIVRFALLSIPHISQFLFYSSPFVFTILHTMAPLENNGLEFYIGAALSEPRSQLYIKSWHVNKLTYGNCQCESVYLAEVGHVAS